MLNKAMISQELGMAKVAHERWVKRAEHLISGMPVEKEFIPLEPTSCGFGKWYYSMVGRTLKSIYVFAPTMEQIEMYHDELHELYGYIYDIYFVRPSNRTLLHKIITFNSKKVTSSEKAQAKEYFARLQEISSELLRQIEKLEKAVRAADLVIIKRAEGALKQIVH